MSTTIEPVATLPRAKSRLDEQRIILNDIPWETYQHLLTVFSDRSVPRMTYNEGVLELMSPSKVHEVIARLLSNMVMIFALKMGIGIEDCGLTTLKNEDVKRGLEPDGSFYIKNEAVMRLKRKLDLKTDPPPDLVIEVDVTSGSLDKFESYRTFGVPEIWHYDEDDGFSIHHLKTEGYTPASGSLSFPQLTADLIRQVIAECETNGQSAALKLFQTLMAA